MSFSFKNCPRSCSVLELDFMVGFGLFLMIDQAAKENILMQITNAIQMVKLEKDPHAAFALIIDGN